MINFLVYMFVGVIDSKRHQQIWCKTILSLASISDNIKFSLTDLNLTLSAINATNTCHADIQFDRQFFYEYKLHQQLFCLINANHLLTLFKHLDPDLSYIVLKFKQNYKLYIEIKTNKDLIKKFQTDYQLVHPNQSQIAKVYKSINQLANFFAIDQSILKSFLTMIPIATEDFKIDIKSNKLSFCGYTKQILHDKHYLKQPMAVTITLNLDDLYKNNLSQNHSINFRLKDFRNFINLVDSFNNYKNNNNNIINNVNDDTNNNIISNDNDTIMIYFNQPGNPILFELKFDHILIQFIQMTGNDDVPLKNSKNLQIIPDKLKYLPNHQSPNPEKNSNGNSVPPSHPDNITPGKSKAPPLHSPPPPPPSSSSSSSSSDNDFITYNEKTPEFDNKDNKRRKINETTISQSEKLIIFDDDQNTQYSSSSQEIDQDLLGPTQANVKPKSIFD